MGHIATKSTYLDLQRRLDQMPISAPPHRALFDILKEVFTEDESFVASRMPMIPSTAESIALNTKWSQERVQSLLDAMIEKGLVVDMPHRTKETLYFLNPTVIGIFEFSMMRQHDCPDFKKLSSAMWEYMIEDPRQSFARMIASGPTYLARPAVHEDALSPEVYSQVLDYEKATHLLEKARTYAVGVCHCRHVKEHKGESCRQPLKQCLSLGNGAEYLIRAKIAEPISKARALEIVQEARNTDCVQMVDNVKHQPTFICNCCKCCCEMLLGFRDLSEQALVVSSNYMATTDADLCSGCGLCAKACPIDVIHMVAADKTDKHPRRKKRASVNTDLCIGCGVCHRHCKNGSLTLKPIGERRHTPSNTIEKMMMQALERGKLQHLIFSNPSKLTHRVMGTFLGALLNLPPSKKLLAQQQLKSKFVGLLMSGVSRP